MNEFLTQLEQTLDSYFSPKYIWAVAALERDDHYIIKAQMNAKSTEIDVAEIPDHLRRLVIWTFSPNGQTAWIKLQKSLDWSGFTAQLMVGNLFGQVLNEERKAKGQRR